MRLMELYRCISQLHENPRALVFAATPVGRLVIWLLATALLWQSSLLQAVPLFLAAALLWPARVKLILGLGSLWYLLDMLQSHGITEWSVLGGGMVAILVLLYGIYRAARHFPALPGPVQKHPLITIHLIVMTALLAVPPLEQHYPNIWPMALLFVALLPFLVWRTGYLMLSARRRHNKIGGFSDHLYYFLPLWDGSNVPYGKGHDYLASHQAQDLAQLTRSRLAGLKLLTLAWLWTGARWLMDVTLYADQDISGPLLYSLSQMINGQTVHLHQAWGGIFADLIYATLGLALFGHFVIGTLRLFGFNVFRNTYKPLLAQSIVDFWNRFYYYFKELLVDFFFYPTFLSYFKKSPRLRMFAAVMAAAFVGNFYYHTIMWLAWGEASFWNGNGLATRIEPYLLYTFMLGLGVYISMLREQARRGKPIVPSTFPWLRALRRIAGVWLFFGLIRIWDVGTVATLEQRINFFGSLFGL